MKTSNCVSPEKVLWSVILMMACNLSPLNIFAQVVWSVGSGTPWLTGTNWVGNAVPGSTQIAQFNVNPTSGTAGIGIDLGATTNNGSNNQAVGAIYASSSRTAALLVGNSSTASNGILTLTGTTVNSIANVVMANYATNGAARQTMTIQNIQGSGSKTMEVALASGSNIVTGAGTSSTAIGNTINITSVISGAAPTFLGSGTYDGTTGVIGGLLKLGATNTFTGGITVGSSSSTFSSGLLELDNKNAIINTSGNNITVNPYSELFLNSTSTDTFTTDNITLNLNGVGSPATYTNTGGALVTGSNKSYTWTGPLNLVTDAKISVVGNATLTASGNISGGGALIKTGSTSGGVLLLSGTANSWTGGTQVIAGTVNVASGSSLGSGAITMSGANTGVNTAVSLNNAAQTITGLTSNFTTTTGTITQTLSLASGHTLTMNFTSDYTYGAGDVNTLTSLISGAGKVIKNGTGRLTLTGKGNFFTGGLKINAGEIRINPSGSFTMTSPDTLNGGTISTVGDTAATGANATITQGTLDLAENTTIYLGTSVAHTLKFAASGAIAWTAGKMLTISGWNGTWGAGTSGTLGKFQVGTTSSGLSVAQLAQVQFIDGTGNLYPAAILSNGEVIPKNPYITTTPASYGPFYNTTSHIISVAFTTSIGTFNGRFKVQLSDTSGAFTADTTTGILDSGFTSPISATIPAGTLFGYYRVRVICGRPNPAFGSDNGNDINILTFPPVITNVSPYTAKPGDTITLTGSNFNATPGNNTIFFGATKGTAVSGNTTSLNVVVPPGATFAPISLNTPAILFGYSHYNFLPTFKSSYFITSSFNLKPKVDFSAGTAPNPAAIGDLDGDGKADLVVPNTNAGTGTTLTLYLNTSTTGTINASSFTSAGTLTCGTGPSNVAIADMDGDGKPEIVVTSLATSSVSVFRNTCTVGTLSFAPRANITTISSGVIGAQPFEVAIADYDGDGKPDMATTSPYSSASNSSISVMRNVSTVGTIGTSSFSTPVSFNTPASLGSNCAPIGIVAADFDGDGKPDFAVACTTAAAVAVYRNTASAGTINSGSFATGVTFSTGSGGSNPIDVQAGDIDGDGKPDLILSNSGTSKIAILRNTSTSGSISFATVVQFSTGSTPTGLALSDINGDGKIDIAVTNAVSNTVSVFRNTSTSGSISLATKVDYTTGTTPYGLNIGDLDNDGYPDLVIGNNGSNNISIIKNYPLPTVAAITGTTTVCGGGGTTMLSNAITDGHWSLTNNVKASINDSTGVVTGNTSGTDTVIYMVIAGGDTNSVQTTITINAAPAVAAIGGPSSVCPSATITETDATGSGTWGITNANATISGSGVVTGATPGADTITYTVTNGFGCSTKVTRPITITALTIAGAITGSNVVCVGGNTTLADTIAGGTWTSSNASRATVNSGTGVVHGVSTGSLTITYTVTGTCNATFTTYAMTVVTVPVTPGAITGTTSLCTGASTTLSDTSSGGAWATSNSAIASVNSGSGLVTAVTPGSATISYVRTNSCGSSYATIGFNAYASLAGSITSATPPCSGYSTTIVFAGTSGARMQYKVDGGSLVDTVVTGGTFSLGTGAIFTSHTYTLHNVYNVACALTIDTTATVNPIPMQWVGGTSGSETDWNTAQNWSCGFVPGAADEVTIPSSTTYAPVIAATASGTTHNLNIAAGATVTLDSAATLNVKGTFTNNGTIDGAGILTLNNTTTQTINGIGFVNNIDINNTAGVNVTGSSRCTVKNTLSVTAGSLATGDSVVLYSDTFGSARVATLPSGTSITGNVRVNQFMSGGRRAYRFWAHPFNNFIPLSQLENYIDISGTGGATNGFTTTGSNQASSYRYDPLLGNSSVAGDPGWRPFTSTYGTPDSNEFKQYQGIRVYYRGSKGQGLGFGPYTDISSTVVSQWGTLNQGNQDISLVRGSSSVQDYNMVGNPYPSPVDVGTVVFNAAQAGRINGAYFWIWNPFLATAGQFQAIPYSTGGGTPVAIPYYLQTNDAFQVRVLHNGDQLNFTESNKSATISNAYSLMKQNTAFLSLYIYDANYHPYDMLSVQFNDAATAAEDVQFDGGKPTGPDFNFYSLSADNHKLSVDVRPYTSSEIIPLGINSSYAQDYFLRTENLAIPSDGKVYLHDKLLKQYIQLQQGTEYRFSVTEDPKTQGESRFELIMASKDSSATSCVNGINMQLTPNPATDQVTIIFNQNKATNVSIRLLDVSGTSVYNTTISPKQNGSITVPLDNISAGIYMIELTLGDQKLVQRLIKE